MAKALSILISTFILMLTYSVSYVIAGDGKWTQNSDGSWSYSKVDNGIRRTMTFESKAAIKEHFDRMDAKDRMLKDLKDMKDAADKAGK